MGPSAEIVAFILRLRRVRLRGTALELFRIISCFEICFFGTAAAAVRVDSNAC
jgi:hypothetical protein